MAEKDIKTQAEGDHSSQSARLEVMLQSIRQDFFTRHGTKLLIAAAMVVGLVLFMVQQSSQSRTEAVQLNEKLGAAFNYLYQNKTDSAAASLEAFIAESKGLPLAKAALLLGNIKFQKGEFDVAATLYNRAISAGKDSELILSGAEHGLATVAIEQKDYGTAISRLESFVSKYGKRTGDLEDRLNQTEEVDPVVTVPDALWKLTLCYAEQQKPEQAKATAQRLLKVYGNSRQAINAKKFLATL